MDMYFHAQGVCFSRTGNRIRRPATWVPTPEIELEKLGATGRDRSSMRWSRRAQVSILRSQLDGRLGMIVREWAQMLLGPRGGERCRTTGLVQLSFCCFSLPCSQWQLAVNAGRLSQVAGRVCPSSSLAQGRAVERIRIVVRRLYAGRIAPAEFSPSHQAR
jgi:hypothetical protein